ncbi:MAG: osmotically inducible protein OsmC [Crocinitomicaceae bacterium]|nr:osmotically inducible protein OsmC [Crocinitomicaceae bacterium]|tara:strand:+ start:53269 stop:53673 length:405 start_codon:yes stop_codon:yes gene_type:complete
MATSKIEYLGDLRTKSIHLASGKEIITDAPLDNNGKGEFFSPTDLVAVSYVSCMLTIIGIYCNNNNIDFTFGHASINKVMSSNPRRIKSIEIDFDFSKNNWDNSIHKRIKDAGESCPVARTIGNNIELHFQYKF